MREIKFRVWDKESKTMQNASVISLEKQCVLTDLNRILKPNDFDLLGYPKQAELMQYTGLKDKNGKEIYEGDIVLDILFHHKFIIQFNKLAQFEASPYISNCYDTKKKLDMKHYNFEIIGNIYENPELLKDTHNEQE